jgi:hypothetical protein
MFVQDRGTTRRYFTEIWQKHRAGEPLEPLEALIAQVILEHPEYQGVLESGETAFNDEYLPEEKGTNPFLHMGLHIALREQLMMDRPPGIVAIYHALLPRFHDPHDLEHRMTECLAEALWMAQKKNVLPDEEAYLECLRRQIR